jgi:hypothetical protein
MARIELERQVDRVEQAEHQRPDFQLAFVMCPLDDQVCDAHRPHELGMVFHRHALAGDQLNCR